MKHRGQQVKGATTTINKIKRLLKAKDLDTVDQGLELLDTISEPRWYDALLEDVIYEQKQRRRGQKTHRLISKRYGAPHQTYVALALLDKAPKDSALANTLRDRIDRLDITSTYRAKNPLTANLSYLGGLPKLRELELTRTGELRFSFAPLLPKLESLVCQYVHLKSLEWLTRAPKLSSAKLERCQLDTPLGLEKTQIESLRLDLNQRTPIEHPLLNPHLKTLDISSFELSAALELPALQQLTVYNCSLSSLKLLAPARSLQTLTMYCVNNRQPMDISPLLELPALQQVSLWSCGAADVGPLKARGIRVDQS